MQISETFFLATQYFSYPILTYTEATAPNYWDLTSEVDEQLHPLKVHFQGTEAVEEEEKSGSKVIKVKVKNLDSTEEWQADDQPDSEDVRQVKIIQV